MLRFLGVGAALLLCAAGGGVGYLAVRKPAQRPASTERIERTPARLARGRYLVEHLTHCLSCHSDQQMDRYGMPPKPGTLGQGGYPFDSKLGVPGVVCAQNITPDPDYGIGGWTDGEVLRAFREGVDRSGDALFPMMPYPYYHSMSDEDARSIVVYLRTLEPVHHPVPQKQLDFPVNLLVKSAPQPLEAPVEAPEDAKDHLAYGKYLVTIAGCVECHSPHDAHGQKLPGKDFSGGWSLSLVSAGGGKPVHVVPPNITPDPDAYFGTATKEQWIGRVKSFASMEGAAPIATPGRNTIMGWVEYAGLTEPDLGAIYDYMKTVPPIKNKVEPFPDAPAGS
jgi:mono/diheme cytochrome c family protein